MKSKKVYNIYILGKELGLNKQDIDNIISNPDKNLENVNFSNGPPWYPGGKYGVISINEFHI